MNDTIDPALLALIEHGRPAFPGEAQDPDDAASSAAGWRERFGEVPRPIRDGRDLLIAIGDHLASLGLEPDLKSGVIDFLFLGRLHRLALIDLDGDIEEMLRGQGDRDLLAAGLPVG